MSRFHLAQVNIGRLLAPIDSPPLADFVANLEAINRLAEQTPGFVWRLQSDAGDATAFSMFDEFTIPNLTVWTDVQSLHAYVYKSAHIDVMKRRKEWFAPMKVAFMALWWIPAGHIPSLAEAEQKLLLLREQGPTPDAFTFRQHFPAPDDVKRADWSLDGHCPA